MGFGRGYNHGGFVEAKTTCVAKKQHLKTWDCQCRQTEMSFPPCAFPRTSIDRTHRCSHLMMNRICGCLLWTMTLVADAVCSW